MNNIVIINNIITMLLLVLLLLLLLLSFIIIIVIITIYYCYYHYYYLLLLFIIVIILNYKNKYICIYKGGTHALASRFPGLMLSELPLPSLTSNLQISAVMTCWKLREKLLHLLLSDLFQRRGLPLRSLILVDQHCSDSFTEITQRSFPHEPLRKSVLCDEGLPQGDFLMSSQRKVGFWTSGPSTSSLTIHCSSP